MRIITTSYTIIVQRFIGFHSKLNELFLKSIKTERKMIEKVQKRYKIQTKIGITPQ